MITEAFLNVLGVIVRAIDALIPALEIPYADEVTDLAAWAGTQMGFLDPVIPIATVAAAFGWIVTTYVPLWFAFVVIRWVYSHIPVVGGG